MSLHIIMPTIPLAPPTRTAPEAGINAGARHHAAFGIAGRQLQRQLHGRIASGATSIYITVFRNWLSGVRAAHPPLNTYTNPVPGRLHGVLRGLSGPFPRPVDVQAHSIYNSFVGNVLGKNGQTLLPAKGCDSAQTAFVLQVTTGAQYTQPETGTTCRCGRSAPMKSARPGPFSTPRSIRSPGRPIGIG